MISGANHRDRAYVLASSVRFGVAEEVMPHLRRVQKGSFGSHLDELLAQFPAGETSSAANNLARERPEGLQERIDIHGLLFDRAWKLEP
jgi:hypothetical protein